MGSWYKTGNSIKNEIILRHDVRANLFPDIEYITPPPKF